MKKFTLGFVFLFIFALSGKNLPDSSYSEMFMPAKSKLFSKRMYATGSFGQNNSTCVGLIYGLKRKSTGKLNFYFGARVTYKRFNSSELFITAPAEMSRGVKGYEAVFKSRVNDNLDTVTFAAGSNMAINLSIHVDYRLFRILGMNLNAEVNADLVGISFGPAITGAYTHNGQMKTQGAKPSGFNLFMGGDNNKGSLNSEFLLRFGPDKISVFAGLGVSMWEQTTNSEVQTVNGQGNDRFRMRSTAMVVGGRFRF